MQFNHPNPQRVRLSPDGDSYTIVKIYPNNATDDQIKTDFPEFEGVSINSEYDCTGRWFCYPARVVRNRSRTLVSQLHLLDV